MEVTSKNKVLSPIHLPCPDMAGCANPNPELTQKSLQWVARCLKHVRQLKKNKPTSRHIPARFARVKGGAA
ncbi:hypothetical protein GT360_07235 [Vibrio astriarenae]|uniref:Uncharacterized protein n=1 Tax=Vibrio astriarenae TaxID=1481923 RepID=A0A7Z2T372_9VIBR|nr:hypothetical protein [Vibrio astriarenae]QIA63323.1 hypothetical protein GT360_07235 [Vibrio astriarenae]